MRNAVRWAAAGLSYSLVLLAAAAVSMALAWGCHHRPAGATDFACSETFSRFGTAIILGTVIRWFCLLPSCPCP